MEKTKKKIFSITMILFIAICNFNIVLADDEIDDINNNNIDESIAVSSNGSTEIDEEIVIDNNITDILENQNIKLDNILMSLNSLPTNISDFDGEKHSYDGLNADCLNFMYDNWDNYLFIGINNSQLHFGKYLTKDNYPTYAFNTIDVYSIEPFVYQTQLGTRYYHIDSTVNGDEYLNGYYKLSGNNYNYELKPHKLFLLEEQIDNIAVNKNADTNIYYHNQLINLSYNNENNDFDCWIDSNTNDVLSYDSNYQFNINDDISIEYKLKEIPPIIDTDFDTNLLIYTLLLFIVFKSFIWGV